MKNFKDIAAGMAVTLTIAIISFLSASLHPSFDALVISIIFGMLVSNILTDRETYRPGAEAALGIFLPVGIGLYGMQLTFAGTGVGLLPAIAIVIAVAFIATYYISRGFGLEKKLSVLLGVGLSVCGASAIAVISPLIGARKEDTSISLISVVTLGLTGMLFYSFVPEMLGLSIGKFAFLTGTTLPMLGQVEIAASTLGGESLSSALNIKLLRISSLAVFALGAMIFLGKDKKVRIPWFMVVFFVLAVLANISGAVASLKPIAANISRFSLTTALAAIGFSIDFDSVTEHGARPLLSVFLSWGIIVLFLYIMLNLINV